MPIEFKGWTFTSHSQGRMIRVTNPGQLLAEDYNISQEYFRKGTLAKIIGSTIRPGSFKPWYLIINHNGKMGRIRDEGFEPLESYEAEKITYIDIQIPEYMTEKVYQLKESFLLKAHAAACSEWKKHLENEFPEAFIRHKRGNHYIAVGTNQQYILCAAGDGDYLHLVNLKTGNRYSRSVKVLDVDNVTSDEFKEICGNEVGTFKFVNTI
jgi:hypothetical protein